MRPKDPNDHRPYISVHNLKIGNIYSVWASSSDDCFFDNCVLVEKKPQFHKFYVLKENKFIYLHTSNVNDFRIKKDS